MALDFSRNLILAKFSENKVSSNWQFLFREKSLTQTLRNTASCNPPACRHPWVQLFLKVSPLKKKTEGVCLVKADETSNTTG